MDNEKKKIPVDLEYTEEVVKRTSENTMYIEFDKIFNNPSLEVFNTFVIKKKKVYCNRNNAIRAYINHFMEYYDNDNELVSAYLDLKFMIDDKSKYSKKLFIEDIYEYILSDTMVEKIETMTENLFHINMSASKRKKKNYNKTVEFTDKHAKIMMNMSLAIKLLCPIVTHYAYKNQIKKANVFLVECFMGLFEVFEHECNMYNKLYETVMSRINSTIRQNRNGWDQCEIRGTDEQSVAAEIVEKLLIDILPKYLYAGNIAHMNTRCIDKNIKFKLRDKYKKNYNSITNETGDDDGLSGFDRLEISTAKFDESLVILGELNVSSTIDYLCNEFKVKWTDEELQFYIDNIKIEDFQKELLFEYFGKYFGGVRELKSMNKVEFCQLIIIFKHILSSRCFDLLQHILTGHKLETVNVKKSSMKKQFTKVDNSALYKNLEKYKYTYVTELLNKYNKIHEAIQIILNSKFTIVDWELKDYLGKNINMTDKDRLSHEILRFVDDI